MPVQVSSIWMILNSTNNLIKKTGGCLINFVQPLSFMKYPLNYMRIMGSILITLAIIFAACGGNDTPPLPLNPDVEVKWEISPASTRFNSEGETKNIIVEANGNWTVSSDQQWCIIAPTSGGNGQTVVKITASKNSTEEARTAELTFVSGKNNKKYNVSQDAGELVVEMAVEPYISDIPFQ